MEDAPPTPLDMSQDLSDPSAGYRNRQRALELSRYFASASVVPGASSESDQALKSGAYMPKDPTLLALAQLGALKLDCSRSFVSLIDQHHQYIIGEATRTVSLQDGDNHQHDDGLYLGRQALELQWGVCPQTIEIFTTEDMSIDTANITANSSRYTIRDFCADPRFASRPYVVGWPFMRSYAEVPLTSPSGFVIGSYCVVDTKARSFEDAEVSILSEVASTIMDHLGLLKIKLDHSRAERLVHGLGSFVTGSSSLAEHQSTLSWSASAVQNEDRGQDLSPASPNNTTSSDRQSYMDCTLNVPMTPATDEKSIDSYVYRELKPPPLDKDSDIKVISTSTIVTRDAATSLARAGNLIRQAMDMDGIVFLDPNDTEAFAERSSINVSPRQTQACATLGCATAEHNSFDYDTSAKKIIDVNTDLMSRLLSNFPSGYVFSGDKHGLITSSPLDPHQMPRDPRGGTLDETGDSASSQMSDLTELFHALPGAHSIVFLPVRDFQRDRWFATIIAWTSDLTRVFGVNDLGYLSAFGNSIVADVSRAEAESTSHAKSDFISSISHELRSPLHGMLAGVETLRETLRSKSDSAMLDTIETCGTLLMDTLAHLMDYAKINSLTSKEKEGNTATTNANNEEMSRNSIVNLSEMLQDVIDGTYLGATAQASDWQTHVDGSAKTLARPSTQSEVTVLVDIDPAANINVSIETGAWRRIIMNLFGNALKYTSRGIIIVKLSVSDVADATLEKTGACKMALLQFQDTGRGMSIDFLRHQLFQPFMQENNLSNGIGLGMSIVKRLVDSLNGNIEVRSEVGRGTQIDISVPLTPEMVIAINLDDVIDVAFTAYHSAESISRLDGCVLSIPALDSMQGNGSQAASHMAFETRAHFTALAEYWLKMDIKDNNVQTEHSDSLQHFVLRPVVHDRATSTCQWEVTTDNAVSAEQGPTMLLSSPFGPRKLITALPRCA